MSTSGHVQYIRRYHYVGGYHVYIRGCSVHRRNTISTLGGMFSTLRGMFSTLGDIMMHVGDTMSTLRDVQHIRGISWCIWGSNLINPFNFYWKPQYTHDIPQCTHDIPWCTEHPSMYSWYPPHASWYPLMYWTSRNVFMISPFLMHSWYPPINTPNILMIFPQYTEDPPMYWTTHYTGWFYVCIKSTNGNILVFFLFNCEFMHF